MRRLAIPVALLLMIPGTALASDIDGLLDRGKSAAYTAEQVITCSTPDGIKDAVVRIAQNGSDLRLTSNAADGLEVSVAPGDWTMSREGDVVDSTEVGSSEQEAEPKYLLDDGQAAVFLGRKATIYEMRDGDLLRAQLIFDDMTGAMMRAVTYTDEGEVYCERRFISFDPTPPDLSDNLAQEEQDHLDATEVETSLPEELAGFSLLDLYSDPQGFVFGYYSDGFFSFAVFETPSLVVLNDSTRVNLDTGSYERAFTPGMVTFAWETGVGAMALIGDPPPDMHEEILAELPPSVQRGWFERLWTSLFG